MGNEIMELKTLEVTELNIPSTKLNFMQEKKYREYGYQVLNEIGEMMTKIQEEEHKRFVAENKQKIIQDIAAKNPGIKKILAKINSRLNAIRSHTILRDTGADELQNQIDALQAKRNNLVENWDNKISTEVIELEKIRNDLNKAGTFDTTFLQRITKDDDNRKRMIEVRGIETDFNAEMLIKETEIEEKLDCLFEKHAKDTFRTRAIIKQMKDKLEEIMLFDEKKLKPLFEQVLALKKLVNGKYAALFLEE